MLKGIRCKLDSTNSVPNRNYRESIKSGRRWPLNPPTIPLSPDNKYRINRPSSTWYFKKRNGQSPKGKLGMTQAKLLKSLDIDDGAQPSQALTD